MGDIADIRIVILGNASEDTCSTPEVFLINEKHDITCLEKV